MNASSDLLSGAPPHELPQLHNAVLQDAQLHQLLDDIEQCTELVEILPKFAACGMVSDHSAVSLARARELLSNREVRALQIRYHYDGADWWDTIMVQGDLFRVVRIRHEFEPPPASQPT